jgi:hypothetical protein
LFLAADRSGDGWLDKEEFLAFSHPEEDEAMKPLIVQQVTHKYFSLHSFDGKARLLLDSLMARENFYKNSLIH